MSLKKYLTSPRCPETASMLLRELLGIAFIYHGYGKMFSPEKWAWLGSQMPLLGTEALAPFWGFMAAFSEFFGGILLLCGLFTRVAGFLIFGTMAVAVSFHIGKGEGFEMPLVYLLLALLVVISGPDKKSLDQKFFG